MSTSNKQQTQQPPAHLKVPKQTLKYKQIAALKKRIEWAKLKMNYGWVGLTINEISKQVEYRARRVHDVYDVISGVDSLCLVKNTPDHSPNLYNRPYPVVNQYNQKYYPQYYNAQKGKQAVHFSVLPFLTPDNSQPGSPHRNAKLLKESRDDNEGAMMLMRMMAGK